MSTPSRNNFDREERVDEAIVEYLEAIESGQPLDEHKWLDRYPEILDELKEFLADQSKVVGWAEPVREAAQAANAIEDGKFRTTAEPPQCAGALEAADAKWGDYELLGEVARGGMGVVYKARQISLRRIVAIKMIRSGQLAVASDLQRFRMEAEAVASLDHRHIMPIYEVGEHEGRPYFSMKLVEGGDVSEHLPRFAKDARATAKLLAIVARAVHHAHQRGILHRDLKPANILLDDNGQPYVTDFGLARLFKVDSGITQSGAIVGTPSYMAPEQAAGSKHLTTAADIYSLGSILYVMLTGRPPFQTDTPLEIVRQVLEEEPSRPRLVNPRVDRDLETICLKCLRKEPNRRYGSAEALAEDLDRWLTGEPIRARRSTIWERVVKKARRNPATAALVVVSCLALILLALSGVVYQEHRATVAERKLADHQRSVADQQKLAEAQLEIQKLISQAEADLAQEEWSDAKLNLVEALAKREELIRDRAEPLLDELAARAERLVEEIDERFFQQQAREDAERDYRRFLQLRSDALFHGTLFTGVELPINLAATRRAGEEALDLYGLTLDGKGTLSLDDCYDAQEKATITNGCYELLLILAEALTQQDPPQFEHAIALLDRARQLGSPTKAYHLRLARYLEQLDDHENAAKEIELAANLSPTTALDHFLLGDDLRRQGQKAAAIAEFDAALRVEPDHFWARYLLATVFLYDESKLAKTHLTSCIRENPEFAYAYYLRGMAHGELSEYEAAAGDFQRSLELCDPDSSTAADLRYGVLINRAIQSRRQGWLTRASDDLREAIRLQPDRYQAYWNFATLFESIHALDAAIDQLDKAIEIALNDDGAEASIRARLYQHRGWLNFKRGDLAAAIGDVEQAIQIKPFAESCVLQARLFEEKGEQAEALETYLTALRVSPADAKSYSLANTYKRLARVQLRLGKYREAIDALHQCVAAGTKVDGDVYRLRGLARAKITDYRGAVHDYTQALTLEPNDSLTHAYRGWVYLVQDALKPALADFEEAIRLDPDNGDAYNGRGYVRVRLADDAGALSDAEEALRRGPETNRMVWNASRIYAQVLRLLDANGRWQNLEDLKTRKDYQNRALQLLETSLALTPSDQQTSFWESIQPEIDGAFAAIRRSPGFVALAAEFGQE